jgi:hypothetical protein
MSSGVMRSTGRGWRRADYAQPAFARIVVLGVLVWLGDLGEIEVDRSAKGEDVRLSLSLQAGPASAGWVFAVIDGAQGVFGLLTGASEADDPAEAVGWSPPPFAEVPESSPPKACVC